MELTETELANINWVNTSTNAREYNYSYKVVLALERLLISVVEQYDSPNLERLRLWFPMVTLVAETNKTTVFSLKRRGTPLYCVIVTNNSITNELNTLRNECILFPYIYTKVTASYPIYDNDIALVWLLPGNVVHYVCENVHHTKTLDVFLREGEYSTEKYLSLYLQVILGMNLAQFKYGLMHNKLITNNVMVDDHLTSPQWLPVGGDYILTLELLRLSGLSNISEGTAVINDIYSFTGSFLYNLRSKRSSSYGVRTMISILTDLLLKLSIPLQLISSILNLSIDSETFTNPLHNKLGPTSYNQTIEYIWDICDKRNINYKSIATNKVSESLSLLREYELSYGVDPMDGYLLLVIQDYDEETTELYLKYLNNSIYNLKDTIEFNLNGINKRLLDIKDFSNLLMKLEYNNLISSLEEYIDLFDDLLLIKLLLDDLRVKLRYRSAIVDDINNSNLSNYIKEKESKMLRTLGENTSLYNNMYKILSPKAMERIDNIWKILNDSTIRIR